MWGEYREDPDGPSGQVCLRGLSCWPGRGWSLSHLFSALESPRDPPTTHARWLHCPQRPPWALQRSRPSSLRIQVVGACPQLHSMFLTLYSSARAPQSPSQSRHWPLKAAERVTSTESLTSLTSDSSPGQGHKNRGSPPSEKRPIYRHISL